MNIVVLVFTLILSHCSLCHGQTFDLSNVIHERFYFSGEIRTRYIVEAVLSSGKKVTVPVINGYVPAIRVTVLVDGSTLREYDYKNNHVYEGGVIEYSKPPVKSVLSIPSKKQMPIYTEEDFESMRSNVKLLEETIRLLREQAVERPPITLQAVPSDESKLKKPSEFGR